MMHSTMEHISIKNGHAQPIFPWNFEMFHFFLLGLSDDIIAVTL